jgi:Kef-type K+ transport system membrane component KefB
MSPAELSIAFFLQLLLIIAACRGVGWLVRRWLGQPQVVGEMIAGVVLGPSLLGLLAPEVQSFLFPPESRPILFVIAQLGVGLYMFIVGLGFDLDHFKGNARSAAAVSLSGIIAPFLVAVLLTPWLLATPGLFAPAITRAEATLFMGACIAITAFPMLARIIHERGISGSPLGTLSLSAGAIDDAAAWMVLAVVLASFGDGPGVAFLAIGGGIAFAAVMLTIAPPLLARLGSWQAREGGITHPILAVTLMLFTASAWVMDAVGIHAVFGGFILGAVMPRGAFADQLKGMLEPLVVILLLPCFFTYSGLNTQLTLVNDINLLGIAAAILVGSVLAKGGACYLAARATGQDHRTAAGIGSLMNARGLMELIIINIGLQRGIIEPALFSIMVVMAIVTTLMASPLFELFYGRHARREGSLGALPVDGKAKTRAATSGSPPG